MLNLNVQLNVLLNVCAFVPFELPKSIEKGKICADLLHCLFAFKAHLVRAFFASYRRSKKFEIIILLISHCLCRVHRKLGALMMMMMMMPLQHRSTMRN